MTDISMTLYMRDGKLAWICPDCKVESTGSWVLARSLYAPFKSFLTHLRCAHDYVGTPPFKALEIHSDHNLRTARLPEVPPHWPIPGEA